ncbi:MAG: DOMON domain-containing protein [Desulfobacula sp.]|nr:DOMON domain-containing protein [Desulfobacula sp.]
MKKWLGFTLFIVIYLLAAAFNLWSMEYQHTLKAKDMVFSWAIDNDQIHVELSAKTTGWVGIGFNPEKSMLDANIIIGAVKKGRVKIEDHFGNRKKGHTSDTKKGGTNHVKNPAGTEADGITTISFTFPLNSGEKQFDASIKADGTDLIMLAYGAGRDSFNSRHPFKAVYRINLKTGENKKVK